jgi:hypothetical protein
VNSRITLAIIVVFSVITFSMIPFQQLTVLPTSIHEAQANPCANEIGRGGSADNAFIPQDDDERECDFTSYFDFEEEIGSEEEPPEEPTTPFIVTGEGSGTLSCNGGPQAAAIIEISVQGDGTGTVGLGVEGAGTFLFPVTGGPDTEGITFSLAGRTSPGTICGLEVESFTVSGVCGNDVTIFYEEPDMLGSFTGDIECTLL